MLNCHQVHLPQLGSFGNRWTTVGKSRDWQVENLLYNIITHRHLRYHYNIFLFDFQPGRSSNEW